MVELKFYCTYIKNILEYTKPNAVQQGEPQDKLVSLIIYKNSQTMYTQYVVQHNRLKYRDLQFNEAL
jgi:hypothetical protein